MQKIIFQYRRWAILGLILLAASVSCGVPVIRHSLLNSVGWALVANDPIKHADVIVVAIDSQDSGVLEAADLVKAGVAGGVAIFEDPVDSIVQNEFIRRGVPYESRMEQSTRELTALGVTRIEHIPGYVEGSEDEGPALSRWCDQSGIGSVLFISAPDHSRRLRRMLRRAIKGHKARVIVRATRYSDFEPDHWWESHGGVRTEIEEGEKLLLDIVRHPFS